MKLLIYSKRIGLRDSPIEQLHRARYRGKAWGFHVFPGCVPSQYLHEVTNQMLSEPHRLGFYGGFMTQA